MEKFSQFRDRGTQIAPFLPNDASITILQTMYGALLFAFRIPLFLAIAVPYLVVFYYLPLGSLARKAYLWSILGIAGVWWVDLQVSGVKRGSLASQSAKLPHPGSIVMSTYTSPLDGLYLAAIFDPIFALTYPTTPLIEHVSLPVFLYRTLMCPPALLPAQGAVLISTERLLRKYPHRTLVIFPEGTPTNGRGILRFAGGALATTPKNTRVFPVSLRYSPADISTPVPGAWWSFFWSLLRAPTHCIRVRIGDSLLGGEGNDLEHKGVEALAKIGRVKRVSLGIEDKLKFIEAWKRA